MNCKDTVKADAWSTHLSVGQKATVCMLCVTHWADLLLWRRAAANEKHGAWWYSGAVLRIWFDRQQHMGREITAMRQNSFILWKKKSARIQLRVKHERLLGVFDKVSDFISWSWQRSTGQEANYSKSDMLLLLWQGRKRRKKWKGAF